MSDSRPVTFVTPVGRVEPQHVQRQLAESLGRFAALWPAPVRWVRALDGIRRAPLVPASGVQTITLDSEEPSHVGAAWPRNRTLPYLLDGWVTPLDADDALKPEGYARLLRLVEDAGRLWGAGRCDDIDADGALLPEWPDTVGQPLLPAGYFFDRRIERGDWAWHCSAMAIDARLVRHVGGWPAAPEMLRSEDTAFTAAVTACAPGVWLSEPVFEYRKHAASVTRQPGWQDNPERLDLIAELVRTAHDRWQRDAGASRAA